MYRGGRIFISEVGICCGESQGTSSGHVVNCNTKLMVLFESRWSLCTLQIAVACRILTISRIASLQFVAAFPTSMAVSLQKYVASSPALFSTKATLRLLQFRYGYKWNRHGQAYVLSLAFTACAMTTYGQMDASSAPAPYLRNFGKRTEMVHVYPGPSDKQTLLLEHLFGTYFAECRA
jgi:hypothetical protein